jgi:hypothetical protein
MKPNSKEWLADLAVQPCCTRHLLNVSRPAFDVVRRVHKIALTPADATCGVAFNTARFSNADYDWLLDERAPGSCELEADSCTTPKSPRSKSPTI